MQNNEKFNALINSCADPQAIAEALLALISLSCIEEKVNSEE